MRFDTEEEYTHEIGKRFCETKYPKYSCPRHAMWVSLDIVARGEKGNAQSKKKGNHRWTSSALGCNVSPIDFPSALGGDSVRLTSNFLLDVEI